MIGVHIWTPIYEHSYTVQSYTVQSYTVQSYTVCSYMITHIWSTIYDHPYMINHIWSTICYQLVMFFWILLNYPYCFVSRYRYHCSFLCILLLWLLAFLHCNRQENVMKKCSNISKKTNVFQTYETTCCNLWKKYNETRCFNVPKLQWNKVFQSAENTTKQRFLICQKA